MAGMAKAKQVDLRVCAQTLSGIRRWSVPLDPTVDFVRGRQSWGTEWSQKVMVILAVRKG